MPIIGARGLIVITRDRRICTRPAELRAYKENDIRSVRIGVKRDLRPDAQVELFLANEEHLQRRLITLGGGPWALSTSQKGCVRSECSTDPTSRNRRKVLVQAPLFGGDQILSLLVECGSAIVRVLLVGSGRLTMLVVILAQIGVGVVGVEQVSGKRRAVGHGYLRTVNGRTASHRHAASG